ncbi:MAG: MoaD/ThiS family protein [Firmicutes bacterium]|nr:MoaD/ThiS family protein [Bacillota bacterium]
MKITVKLFAFLRRGRFKIKECDLPEGFTVGQVLDNLSISREEMKIGIILINGKHGKFDSILHTDDTLAIFPPAAGG